MGNAAEKKETVSSTVIGVKGYQATDQRKFSQPTPGPKYLRPHPTVGGMYRWRLPLIFGLSVLLITTTFVSVVLLLSRSKHQNAQNASTVVSPKVVTIEKETPIERVTVLLPKNDIQPGQKLSPDDFYLAVRPKIQIPVTALTRYEQLSNSESKALLVKGSPVTDQMVLNVKNLNPVIASIQPGFRAVTILVNAMSSVEGWATAGAYVDVHWVTRSFGGLSVNLLAQNAKIISAERQVEQKGANPQPAGAAVPTTITLLVNDRDAQRISLASTGGELKLHLRGTEDTNKPAEATMLTLNDLLGSSEPDKQPHGVIRVRDEHGTMQEFSLKHGEIITKKLMG